MDLRLIMVNCITDPSYMKWPPGAQGLGVKGRAGVSEIELDGHAQCTLGFKENNFQTQRAAPT